MERYIDADKLLEVLNEELMYESTMHTEEHEEYLKKGLRIAINDVKRFPTADVVPRAEVDDLEMTLEVQRMNLGDAREALNDAECEIERLKKAYAIYEETSGLKQAKTEVAREIFEEIDIILSEHYGKASEKTDSKLLEPLRQAQRFVINEIYDDLAELKKKYTEEKHEKV